MILKYKKNNSFLKKDRLTSPEDYKRVFSKATRYSDEFLTVLVRETKNEPAKLGLAIAKKQVKQAVLRNKIKRVIRESFRLRKHTLNGLHIVVLCRQKAGSTSKKVLSSSINKHFDRLLK